MSRKWLDDGVELRGNEGSATGFSYLPSQSNTRYTPGHMFLDATSGIRFFNEGHDDRNTTNSGSLFVSKYYNAKVLEEDLNQLPGIAANSVTATWVNGINQNLMLSGTNAADTGATFDTDGTLLLTTAGAAADSLILGVNTGTNSNTVWKTISYAPANSIVFQTQLVTNATITNQTLYAGLKLTSTATTATDDDQTFFRYVSTTNSGKWQIIDSTAGVDNAQDSGVVVAASTSYLLQIKVGLDLAPRYYINGVLVGVGKPLTSAAALKPFIGVLAGASAAAASVGVRYVRIVIPRAPIVTGG